MAAWGASHTTEEQTGKFVNDWLKSNYQGKTWSKMNIEQMRDAIAKLKGVNTATGEMPDGDPGPDASEYADADDPEYKAFLTEPDGEQA